MSDYYVGEERDIKITIFKKYAAEPVYFMFLLFYKKLRVICSIIYIYIYV